MSPTIYKLCLGFIFIFCWNATARESADLRLPVKQLFNHKKHTSAFSQTKLNCTDCHSFSVKSPGFDPLSINVGSGYLMPNRKVCHECHLGKVQVARVNQCSLCHLYPEKLAPESHKLSWPKRHGQFAQMDSNSCTACHKDNQNSCNNCHSQRNTVNSVVHRANFRLTHSIEARANPARCLACHTVANRCTDCHIKGISR